MFNKEDIEEVEDAVYNFAAVMLEKATKAMEYVHENMTAAGDEAKKQADDFLNNLRNR